VENESDVERREKEPTRDEKGGAMLWHVTNQPIKICEKIGIYRYLCQDQSNEQWACPKLNT